MKSLWECTCQDAETSYIAKHNNCELAVFCSVAVGVQVSVDQTKPVLETDKQHRNQSEPFSALKQIGSLSRNDIVEVHKQ